MNPTLSLVPLPLVRLIGLLIFAESAYFLTWYSRTSLRAARRTDIHDPSLRAGARWVSVVLSLAFAAALVIGDGAHFPLGGDRARQIASGLPLLVLFVPATLWFTRSRAGRTLLQAIDPDSLIRVQAYRMAGVMFLFPLLAYGALPAEFAWPAGIGDFVTGLCAPWVARAVEERRPGAFGMAVAWNVFGMLDLVVAVATAVHSKSVILALYPVSLVPLFLGPPLGLMTHVLSLRSLGMHRQEFSQPCHGEVDADRSSSVPVR